jgi:hypothetical protein
MTEQTADLNTAWDLFCKTNNCNIRTEIDEKKNITMPKCSELYISTKTIICYLNKPIDINYVFWEIPLTPYYQAINGVLKKEIKITTHDKNELDDVLKKLNQLDNVKMNIITNIDNLNGRIKFKDVRKISIGLCKKDILTTRAKQKSAFYNCFVIILRIKHNDIFKEIHIKVFNTGKLEIPGIQDDKLLDKALDFLVTLLNNLTKQNIKVNPNRETVLINSNFNCNYFIDREKLFNILKYNYNINSSFDACSYPGIQSKCYYNKLTKKIETNETENSSSISFMIFRTGSVLIVGKSEEYIIRRVYQYLIDIFKNEYHNIYTKSYDTYIKNDKSKRLKKIFINC